MSRPDPGVPIPPGGAYPPAPPPLQRADPLDGYARFYAALAVLTVVLTFQPLFARGGDDGASVLPMLSLWDELAETGHSASVLGAFFFVLLTAVLVAGAFGLRSVGVAVGIALAAVVLVVLILARPGYGEPTPDLTSWGQIGVVVGIIGVLLAVGHALHLVVRRRTTAR